MNRRYRTTSKRYGTMNRHYRTDEQTLLNDEQALPDDEQTLPDDEQALPDGLETPPHLEMPLRERSLKEPLDGVVSSSVFDGGAHRPLGSVGIRPLRGWGVVRPAGRSTGERGEANGEEYFGCFRIVCSISHVRVRNAFPYDWIAPKTALLSKKR